MIAAVVITDRGDLYLPRMYASMRWAGNEPDTVITVDDRHHRLGMAGAVRAGWEQALAEGADYVFHIEEDFEFNEPVNLDALRYIIDRNPHLAQVVLKRQPWSLEEREAGGIIERNPAVYTEHGAFGRSVRWVEHDQIFSLNPCLIPKDVLAIGWPDGNEAEFTTMCRDRGLRFAFYGRKNDPPRVTHIGEVRGSGWRL